MKYLKSLLATLMIGLTAVTANALTIGDTRDLGLIDPNHPASVAASADFINILTDRPLNSGPTVIGDNAYTRTGNDPLGGVYPDATVALAKELMPAALTAFGSGFIVPTIGLTYTYILAKYDGPNYGSVVWYVGDLAGNLFVPQSAGGYGLSHVTLFNPIPTPRDPGNDDPTVSVPDGGMTALLLGLGLLSVGILHKRTLLQAVVS